MKAYACVRLHSVCIVKHMASAMLSSGPFVFIVFTLPLDPCSHFKKYSTTTSNKALSVNSVSLVFSSICTTDSFSL